MPNKQNVAMLEKVAESLEASKGFYIVDYRGLSVKEVQEVRRALTAAGAHMKVYKNNIVRIALQNAELPAIDEMLEGTCAYVFYDEDPVAAAKVLKEYGEKLKKMAFVGAIADGVVLSAEDCKTYADLPSQEELVAKLVYVLASPLSGIASVCAGPARAMATVVDAIAKKAA